MKHLFLFLTCAMVAFAHAEKETQKFGNVTDNEVKMTTFPADTSADAVVLYEKGSSYYEFNNGFQVICDVYAKIKILKPEGTEYANIEVPYVDYGLNNREFVQGVDGYAYNYANGKVEKTRLDKKYIFTDNTEGKHFRLKFTLPNVKAGSLIEYKFTVVSDFDGTIRPWRFQRAIPVVESIYDVTIPDYFTFNFNAKGYCPFVTVKDIVSNSFFIGNSTLNASCNHFNMKAVNLPALKKESYVSYMGDYYSSVSFEISGIQIPGEMYKSFAYTWNDVEKQLLDDDEFGGNLKHSGFFKDEVKAIVASRLSNEEKISSLYHMLQTKIKWNEKTALYASSLKKAIKDGEGNSAEINFILINVLKDAGFDAYPVVLSSREEGRLPIANASVNSINYFVVGVTTPDSITYYMDASRKTASVNVLDEEYLVDRARAIRGTDGEQSTWVDLTHIVSNLNQTFCLIKFEDGKMIVDVTERKNNQYAYEFRENYKKFKNQDELIESLQNKYAISISNYSVQGLDSVQQSIVEKYTFTKPFDLSDSIAYINPLTVFKDGLNPFKAEKRDLPVEFDYPFTDQTSVILMLPKGYVIEALPKSEKSTIKENDATYRYLLQKQDQSLQMLSVISLNQTLYPVTDYSYLRDFWAHWIAKNNQEIVLKKETL
jgi:hypothetical protein